MIHTRIQIDPTADVGRPEYSEDKRSYLFKFYDPSGDASLAIEVPRDVWLHMVSLVGAQ